MKKDQKPKISPFSILHSPFPKGFTLIELLVVISIIGILATLLIANLSGARSRARDAQRKANLREIQNAIQMYYNDNKAWPCEGTTCPTCQCDTNCPIPSDDEGRWNLLRNLLERDYINQLPVDPLPRNDERSHQYTYGCKIIDGNTEYEIEAVMENKSDPDALNDGGSSNILYEKGTNLTINPRSWFGPAP